MRLRDWVIALSLANLCFLQVWAAFDDRTQLYFRKLPPSYSELAGITLDVLLLAALFAACIWITHSIKRTWFAVVARVAFLCLMILPLRNIRWQVSTVSTKPIRDFLGYTGALLVATLLAGAVVLWNRRLTKVATVFLLVMAPLFVINVGRTFAMICSLDGAFADRAPAAVRGPAAAGPRVVLLLFDELDYRLVFQERPRTLQLPHLDRLRAESVFAANTFAAQKETLVSVPSILTGRDLLAVWHGRNDDLTLDSGSSAVRWSRIPNVFSGARELGFRTALVGWFHPYCRVLGNAIDQCFWEPGWSGMPEYARPVPVLNNMRLQLRRQLKVTPILRNLGNNSVERRGHALAYTEVHPRALAAAADSSFGFVFLHYPIPHPPGIFDPETNELNPRKPHGYAGNLELVDRALGELRAAMERAGAWDQTALILTSDHPLRLDFWPEEAAVWGRSSGSPNVPFMVKLPGEKQGLTYASALNNRIVHDLALALLRGEIRTPQELVQWLDARPGAAPSETVAAATR